MQLKNLKSYTPEAPKYGAAVQYFIDENGKDLYDHASLFTKKFVVFYDKHNVVRGFGPSDTVTRHYPLGLSITDVNSLPEGLDLSGEWTWVNGSFTRNAVDVGYPVSMIKKELLRAVAEEIEVLRDAEDIGMASVDEVRRLKLLKRYRLEVSRISDDMETSEVDWSTLPKI